MTYHNGAIEFKLNQYIYFKEKEWYIKKVNKIQTARKRSTVDSDNKYTR